MSVVVLNTKMRLKLISCRESDSFNRRMDINSNYQVNLVKKKSPLAKENQVETFGETSYFHEDGLRKVKPYYFTHHTFAKFSFHSSLVPDFIQDCKLPDRNSK